MKSRHQCQTSFSSSSSTLLDPGMSSLSLTPVECGYDRKPCSCDGRFQNTKCPISFEKTKSTPNSSSGNWSDSTFGLWQVSTLSWSNLCKLLKSARYWWNSANSFGPENCPKQSRFLHEQRFPSTARRWIGSSRAGTFPFFGATRFAPSPSAAPKSRSLSRSSSLGPTTGERGAGSSDLAMYARTLKFEKQWKFVATNGRLQCKCPFQFNQNFNPWPTITYENSQNYAYIYK